MLPVIMFEPVRFNLDRLGCTYSGVDNAITLHPITVEFDRLLRRQQQLQQHQHPLTSSAKNASSRRHPFVPQSSMPNGKTIKQHTTMMTDPNMYKSPSSNFAFNSSNHSLASSCNSEPFESILSGYDVYELLYASIIHNYTTLNLARGGRTEEDTTTTTLNDKSNKGNGNICNIRSAKRMRETSLKASLAQIHRTLCTPGTRTIIMLADRHEIANRMAREYFDRPNKLETDKRDKQANGEQSKTQDSSASEEGVPGACDESLLDQAESVHLDDTHLSAKENIKKKKKSKNDELKQLLESLDCFLQQALQRKINFYRQLRMLAKQPRREVESHGDPFWLSHVTSLTQYIGPEQLIVGSVTYFKSYRLSGVKMIELASIAVQAQYQRNGIGSYLLRSMKENGQIGLYDVIRVRLAASSFFGASLVRLSTIIRRLKCFFAHNDFSDDLVLNASFDQLDSIHANQDEDSENDDDDDDDEDYYDDDDYHIEDSFVKLNNFTKSVQHSISLLDNLSINEHRQSPLTSEGTPTRLDQHHRRGHHRRRLNDELDDTNGYRLFTVTMCYLPPFSISSLSNRALTADSNATACDVGESRATLSELDNRYIDEIIDEANRSWRANLLSSYRTQWSAVSRLRAEMHQLRSSLRQKELQVDQLRRENYQLRTTLLQSERSLQLGDTKQLLFLKTLPLDSLNF